MSSHETTVRVRYGETDQMGCVYHARYLDYFEVGRTELLRSRGLTYRELEAQGILLPVVEATVRYHEPARYDDLLTLRTAVVKVGGASSDFRYELLRERALRAEGTTRLACLDRATGRPRRLPAGVARASGGD